MIVKEKHTLFHNSRCSKSRNCLKIIREKNLSFNQIEYIKEGLSLSTLTHIVDNLIDPLRNLVRTNEKEFKSNPIDTSDEKMVISFLNKYPKCMQRPLFYDGLRYVICRPPETVINYL
tara:strand:+ start:78 stop:431 length:354 start_codon:yes stop_codon:yes gene_type:complete